MRSPCIKDSRNQNNLVCLAEGKSRHCLYHCLQILSARAILYTSQNDDAQQRLVQEGPLKVLISSIDSTNDPVSIV
ncbi:hypothetical protein QR98_0104470 [Sarcoptes scabiei]|uniref:Uncharacterized protein n=1 Tax=Sarcoptes scabiei TaxID=52283 RepID=A0A132AMY3_SARSC|nr:hypothetical protein QR98_0104470 [Sarcoptes scabiei]